MSQERRSYQRIRGKADRARVRLAATLEQSRLATARDDRTDARRVERETALGGERKRPTVSESPELRVDG
jgi:hypothetical protein